jgi:hypothetical protein
MNSFFRALACRAGAVMLLLATLGMAGTSFSEVHASPVHAVGDRFPAGVPVHATGLSSKPSKARAIRHRLGSIGVPFIENRGQTDARVAFYAHTFAGTAFVTRHGELVLDLPGARTAKTRQGWALTETPVSTAKMMPKGTRRSATNVSVFQGRDARTWRRHLSTFRSVRVGHPWPGIAYAIRAHGNNIERVFTVAPHANAQRIRMRVGGARGLRVRKGSLAIVTGNGPVALSRPVAYQVEHGRRVPVNVAYVVDGDQYGFRLGAYDHARPVVIDPLIQSTYLGGSGFDEAKSVSVSSNGDVYVAGRTTSTNFPDTTGGAVATQNGGYDVFVAMYTPALDSLVQATYLGANDVGAVLVRPDGEVYLAGTAVATLPGATGGAQATCAGAPDGFVTLFSSDLTSIVQSTYLGGSGADILTSMAIGSTGRLYVAGYTQSSDFPGTSTGYETTLQAPNPNFEAMVAELSPDLTSLVHATYLGTTDNDSADALLVSGNGDVYVGGETSGTFPGTTGGAQATVGGGGDAFVAKLNAGLNTLVQATYYGGTASETGRGLALGANGNVYLAGTTSGSPNLLGTSGGAISSPLGNNDAYIAEFSADLKSIVEASYLGGSGVDNAEAVGVDPGGHVIVTGFTYSTDFYLADAGVDNTAKGNGDAFAASFSSDLTKVMSSTYLGGSSNYQNDTSEEGRAVAFGPASHPTHEIYVVGNTYSNDFPVTAGAPQPNKGDTSNDDGFVARFDDDFDPLKSLSISGLTDTKVDYGTASATESFTVQGTGTLSVTAGSSDQSLVPDSGIQNLGNCTQEGSCTVNLGLNPGVSGSATVTFTLKDNYGQSTTQSIVVTINPLIVPSISGLKNLSTTLGNTVKGSFSVSASGSLSSVVATSSNASVLTDAQVKSGLKCDLAAKNCSMTLAPSGSTGKTTITVKASDNFGQTTTGTFVLSVQAVPTSSGGGGGGGGSFGPWGLAGLAALAWMAAEKRRRVRP